MTYSANIKNAAVILAEQRSRKSWANVYAGRARVLLERSFRVVKSSTWPVVLSGFIEPVFYLAAFGYGVGPLIGDLNDGFGHMVSYPTYVAPALLATSAMNGAFYDSTWNVFFKMHFGKTYQAMMATSIGPLDVALGEISWALIRGLAYAIGFMVIVSCAGLVVSPWAILAIPAAVLIAFGFAAVGMAITSYLKSFQQMDWVTFWLLPMFLFSGTFYPVSVYPDWLTHIVRALPLWQAADLVRGLMLGNVSMVLVWHVLYFAAMIAIGLTMTTKRLTSLFMR
ncbi:MAG: ABC transporter [Actinobacteria bacterium]|nr:ABC transporter [Actinomycetota bacterium]NBY16080.1 ABC transporter [Actinomycetota bacterium]